MNKAFVDCSHANSLDLESDMILNWNIVLKVGVSVKKKFELV